VLAVASTWPLAARLRDGLPLGTDQTATVPLFQSWSLWWTADRVAHGFDHFWDAPIFHPTLGTFLFSDPLLLEGLLATPLIWLGATPALAHNLLLLLALVTNGAVAFGLLRSVGLDLLAAASGGAMMLMLPYVHHELGVLMLAPLSGVLATLWALLCFARTPSLGPGLLLGAAAAATYLLCGQYGLFLAVVVVPSAVWLVRADLGRPRALVALAAGAALCGLLVAPLALAQLEALSEHAFGRSRGRALAGASFPEAWLVTPWPQLLPLPRGGWGAPTAAAGRLPCSRSASPPRSSPPCPASTSALSRRSSCCGAGCPGSIRCAATGEPSRSPRSPWCCWPPRASRP
jgi:hypothetical protein